MKKFLTKERTVPRWIVLLIDLVITSWCFGLSYFIVKQFQFPDILRGHFIVYTGAYCTVSVLVFFFMKIHTGLIRYSNTQDMFRIFSAIFISSLIYLIVLNIMITPVFNIHSLNTPAVLMINFFIAFSFLTMFRITVKGVYCYMKKVAAVHRKKVLIYGSDNNAILVKQALEACNNDSFIIAGFIGHDKNKVNSYIEQKRVYDMASLAALKQKLRVDKLVLMNTQLGVKEKKAVLERCLRLGLQVLTVPPADQWMSGKLKNNQIQDLKIEDLLQREPIVIDTYRISKELVGKRVLITGAAGSIGSEIARQVLNYDPEMVILCDQAESPLHEIQLEVEENFMREQIKVFIADINNFNRMYYMFNHYRPEIIFHAAAYKHVPMMEMNPVEAVMTNVMGTKNIADLAVLFDAKKFVMVSTDKAVNPTNVMGATKRIAEVYIQSLNNYEEKVLDLVNPVQKFYKKKILNDNKTRFVTTRFGNVLGSNGSVIPRFRNQIQQGKAVTVTHPDITRYFMTIPEAVELVLEAGSVGEGGEIFVFDMGEPVKIIDLARNMIKLAGMEPDIDVPILVTGLRPGEKLYEELLNEDEKTCPTHHKKIKIAKVVSYPYTKIAEDIANLGRMTQNNNELDVVKKMKEIVPEFISKNSRFEDLDQSCESVKEEIIH